MVLEHGGSHASQWEAIVSIAAKIGCSGETLRKWVRQAERDHGLRSGPMSAEQARIKALERENRELARRTRSCARPRLILRWRSSTAARSHDRLHRRSPPGLRGRADLSRAADRPVDLLGTCRPATQPRAPTGPSAAGRDPEIGDPPGLGGISGSTAYPRFGGNLVGRASRWPVARPPG